jgi:hypothetical protein
MISKKCWKNTETISHVVAGVFMNFLICSAVFYNRLCFGFSMFLSRGKFSGSKFFDTPANKKLIMQIFAYFIKKKKHTRKFQEPQKINYKKCRQENKETAKKYVEDNKWQKAI